MPAPVNTMSPVPRDTSLPLGYHASIRTWKRLRSAPLLHTALDYMIAIQHVALQVPLGETRKVYLHKVQYPWDVLDEEHSWYWEHTWTQAVNREAERGVKRGDVLSVGYRYDVHAPETMCTIVKKEYVMLVETQAFQITKITAPVPTSIVGSQVFFAGGFFDHFDIDEITDENTSVRTTRGTVRSAATSGERR